MPLGVGPCRRCRPTQLDGQITSLDFNVNAICCDNGWGHRFSDWQFNEGGRRLVGRLRQVGTSRIRQFTQPAEQNVVIDAMVSSHRGDRHAWNAASGNQLGFELGALGATTTAGLWEMVVGVHVSTIYYVGTMLLDLSNRCQMPDAYMQISGLCQAGSLFMNVMSSIEVCTWWLQRRHAGILFKFTSFKTW